MAAPERMTLVDLFPLLRARDHPGETVRLIAVGVVAGRSAQRVQRLLGMLALWVVVVVAAIVVAGPGRAKALMLACVLVAAFAVPVRMIVGKARPPRPTGIIGVMVTDVRAVVAEQLTWGEPRIVAEVASGPLTLARLERVDRFWVPGGLTRVELGGEVGPLIVMDLGGAQARTVQLGLEEAGMALLPSTTVPALRAPDGRLDLETADPAVGDPAWVARSFGIVIGSLLGLVALLAVAGSMYNGDVLAGVVSVVLAALFLGGAIVLLQSRPRSSPGPERSRPTG